MTARVPVNPGRLVYLDNLGFDVPSFFNVYRDTFFISGDEFYESMDAGFDSLVYEFPLLSSGREYTLRLYFYNPWDRKLKLRLEVDGSSRGNAVVKPGSLEVVERNISRRVVDDSLLVLRVKRREGAYAVLSGFEIYEKVRGGGIQTQGEERRIRYFLSVPSIVSGKGYLRFGIPEAGEVKIRIYDVLGRRRYMLSSRFNPGIYRIPLPLSRMPQGIYFLLFEYDKRVEKKKIVVIR